MKENIGTKFGKDFLNMTSMAPWTEERLSRTAKKKKLKVLSTKKKMISDCKGPKSFKMPGKRFMVHIPDKDIT